MVAGQQQEPWDDRPQEIVFIGIGMDEAWLRLQIEACLLTDGEMKRGAAAWAKLSAPFPPGVRPDRLTLRTGPALATARKRKGSGGVPSPGRHGSRTVLPVVLRASSARCASAASFSAKVWFTRICTAPEATTSNRSRARSIRSSRFAV